MNILITGANGFIGKNLCIELDNKGFEILPYDLNSSKNDLLHFIDIADFVIHLAGINRPLSVDEFYDGNANLTKTLIDSVINSG
ncbi:MAG: NAD-dependent epimerase/dehydratase family protein, partial [Erysipelotrichia bacterium]|nr:NAD-dependent epimerase/dehydratase family protein [Erysipelotrichia bacterium]